MIKLVGLSDVTVERCRVELGEDINAFKIRIDAIGDRNIDETILPCQRNRRLRPIPRQRKQAGSLSAAHDDRKNVAGVAGHSRTARHRKSFLANPDAAFISSSPASEQAASKRGGRGAAQ